jgi:hypothetical protein
MTLAGAVENTSPELRDLSSNDSVLTQVAARTGGKVLPPFDPADSNLFRRDGLTQTASPLPIWDVLVPILLALLLMDVAIRRIAWDWASTKRAIAGAQDYVRSFTTTRQVETRQSIDALKRIRTEGETTARPATISTDVPAPAPSAKFEAPKGVEGDITQVVGGATDKPVPAPPKKAEPKGAPQGGSSLSSLKAAKQRAQQKIREQEKPDTDRGDTDKGSGGGPNA